jgi:arginine repressor
MDPNGKSHAQLLVQERTERDLEELLRELYVEKRHSQQEIAAALTAKGVKVSRSAVKEWLADFGITRDDRPAVTL